eukprot:CAMPEP_0201606528 /NCGR_PEP_ID=MMETSP0492-20130828/5950_1 /ASSEMBLY_ACC=CAM_ASM_000837 /TAXON_ID=420259 /ORGANISM="Thalassiosira gravida, Strain GMp14c1" /LENGTH=82 /DNA_ID=CAMNT_0048070953 /DNA_START=309 /DNA_END=557 /DNA_ORIENTATION=+
MPSHAAPTQPQQIIMSTSAATLSPSSSSSHDRSSPSFPGSSSSSCLDSYKLFKKCSMSRETEGFSCSVVVASYMRCALNEGC